jgi:hypothetical protein
MSLSKYHQKYKYQSDGEIEKKAEAKECELLDIFSEVSLNTNNSPTKVAVLGCGDIRFVNYHKIIFEKVLKREVEVTTFDITIEHLLGEKNIIEHDCTLSLPSSPYDITYGHVLLKFIETEKQWNVIKNSYEALSGGGLAIHILDKEEIETKEKLLSNGQFSVPLERWEEKLKQEQIKYFKIPIKYGLVFVIQKDK